MLLQNLGCVNRGLQLLQFFKKSEVLIPDFLIAVRDYFLI